MAKVVNVIYKLKHVKHNDYILFGLRVCEYQLMSGVEFGEKTSSEILVTK